MSSCGCHLRGSWNVLIGCALSPSLRIILSITILAVFY
jgi:hypothetical protein